MTLFVYRTARGLLRTVRAEDAAAAWLAACQKHRLTHLYALSGEASLDGGALRYPDADVPDGHARALYLDACFAELSPMALRMLCDIADGRGAPWSGRRRAARGGAPMAQRALISRGLLVGDALTDIGKAFVARRAEVGGGGQ
jgi:hypothetical protein